MLEIKDGINFHNFYLDCKPDEWFKRNSTKETPGEWLKRISYKPEGDFREKLLFQEANDFWIRSSQNISIHVLSFLRRQSMHKSELEDLLGFELNLKGQHDWTLSELKKLELFTNLDLCKEIK